MKCVDRVGGGEGSKTFDEVWSNVPFFNGICWQIERTLTKVSFTSRFSTLFLISLL